MTLQALRRHLQNSADPEKARLLRGFFKTGPGQYGEGDEFLGVVVPTLRKLAAQCGELRLADVQALLRSRVHEERLLALLILVRRFAQSEQAAQLAIFRLYLTHRRFVNNWDLVDSSAPHIVGSFLLHRERSLLDWLADSPRLWDRRIAVVSTHCFIRHQDYTSTLRLAAGLLDDPEDLMHKALGWMLREVGKRDQAVLEGFLREHHGAMPRTMLRYAIERFPEPTRLAYLRGHLPQAA